MEQPIPMPRQDVKSREAQEIHHTMKDELEVSLLALDPSIPSLFLWDAAGLKYFESIMQSSDYYLMRLETEILSDQASSICDSITDDTVIIDFGSGCTVKTGILLQALADEQKSIDYYSLDVSESEVMRNLERMKSALPKDSTVRCQPLVATYVEGLQWLATSSAVKGRSVVILWLGSSMGNECTDSIRDILHQLENAAHASQLKSIAVLATLDSTLAAEKLHKAYDVSQGYSRQFILNALFNTNKAFQSLVFHPDDWEFFCSWLSESATFCSGVRALCDTSVQIPGGRCIPFQQNQFVRIIHSRKWTLSDLESQLLGTRFRVDDIWMHHTSPYGLYRFICDDF